MYILFIPSAIAVVLMATIEMVSALRGGKSNS